MDWSAPVVAAGVAALLCAAAGLGVPALIGALPEPVPKADPLPESDVSAAEGDASAPESDVSVAEGDASAQVEEEPKELYADLARLPALVWKAGAVAALVGGLLGYTVGWSWTLVFLLPLVPVGVALSVIDWRTKLLPVWLVYPTTAGVVLLGAAVGFLTSEPNHLWRALLGAAISRSVFWVLWFIRSAGMGFGDVRLAAILGFVLAWFGWPHLFIGLWVAFLAFGVPGLMLAIFRRDAGVMKKAYPFGPFLLIGAVVGVAWGAPLGNRLVGG